MGRASKVPVDVSLGDSMNISRQHAKIVYNFERRAFELIVMGKNGEHSPCLVISQHRRTMLPQCMLAWADLMGN